MNGPGIVDTVEVVQVLCTLVDSNICSLYRHREKAPYVFMHVKTEQKFVQVRTK